MMDASIDLVADIARWLHVLAAIAWMGFGLWLRRLAFRAHPPVSPEEELEVWDTHSLGFWRTTKISMPTASQLEGMVWSFNQIRWLLLTGLVLFGLVYFRHSQIYLVDTNVYPLSGRNAVVFSLMGLAGAPLINEIVNRIPLRYKLAYNLACVAHVLGWVYVYSRLYSQHGAMIQVGAMLGLTIATNILGYLYPATRAAVHALAEGRCPDPEKKKLWDRRNNHSYLLPAVIFLMLSSHMGMVVVANGHTFSTIVVVLGLSVMSRWILEETHRHGGVMPLRLRWVTAGTVVGLGVGLLAWAGSLYPARPDARVRSSAVSMDALRVESIVRDRCAVCHAAQPSFPGMASPPRGIVLTSTTLPHYAGQIAVMVHSQRMPPGNVTGMLPGERRTLMQWATNHGR